jgi:hypothetical protein
MNKYELENYIYNFIKNDNGRTTHFEYVDNNLSYWGDFIYNYLFSQNNKEYIVKIITYNIEEKIPFLLVEKKGISFLDALIKIKKYLDKNINQKKEKVYTVQWWKNTDCTTRYSFFSGNSITEIEDKFFYGKERQLYTIYNIRLSPES